MRKDRYLQLLTDIVALHGKMALQGDDEARRRVIPMKGYHGKIREGIVQDKEDASLSSSTNLHLE